jgi:hypothetical protein
MIPSLRQSFNAAWSPEKYRAFLDALDHRCSTHVQFRVCETPCFFPAARVAQVAAAGAEMLEQLLDDAAYLRASDATIPAPYRVPGETPRPLFAAVDFGLVRTATGALEPRLVEIQGFPSLYCFQVAMAQQFVESHGLDGALGIIADGASVRDYLQTLRAAIVGPHDPEQVVLLEIDPLTQKTLPDFLLTEKQLGVRAVNIRDVVQEGRRLFYPRSGKRVPIQRIYNRAIVDELERKQVSLPFRFTDLLDVEWAGHPNWFFRLSKFSIPYLRHPFVPQTWFLDRIERVPEDLDNYVLKPLYSFAGLGVVVGPTAADLAAIPPAHRHHYILQQRMRFAPVIETPHGPTQAEIRALYIDRSAIPGGFPQPPATHLPSLKNWALGPLIIRMGRGKMMGVDHNRDLEWVGASAGLIV